MNFDKILTKFGQMLTIYAKNHKMHVKQIRNVIFSKNKNNVRNQPEQKKQRQTSIKFSGIVVLGEIWGIGGN